MANGGDFAHLPPDMHAIAQLDAEARVAHIRAEVGSSTLR
jgi:hypothetical protein